VFTSTQLQYVYVLLVNVNTVIVYLKRKLLRLDEDRHQCRCGTSIWTSKYHGRQMASPVGNEFHTTGADMQKDLVPSFDCILEMNKSPC